MNSNSDIDLFITGDFCIQDRVRLEFKAGNRDIILNTSKFSDADIRITNLEGAFIDYGTPTIKTGPSLQNPESTAAELKYYGFDLLCLANNHLMDFGDKGLFKTLELAETNQLSVIGAGINKEKAKQPHILSVKGKKIAIINIAENEFGGASLSSPGFYGYDSIEIFYQMKSLRESVNKIVVIFHGGHEHYHYPSPDMKKRYRYIIDAGADVVVAHHPHVYSGFEFYKKGFIAYSLGNFIFDKPAKRNSSWNKGIALQLTFTTDDQIKAQLFPYKQCDEEPKVDFLEGMDRDKVLAHIDEINSVISDDSLLQSKWNEFLKIAARKYLTYVEVPNNKYIRGARYYKLIPGWLTKRHKALLLNLMRCESHAEIIKQALDKK